MMHQSAKNSIATFRKQWLLQSALQLLLHAITVGCAIAIIVGLFTSYNTWLVACVLAVFIGVVLFVKASWQVSNTTVTNHLNQHYPIVEDSSELLLKDADSLNILERLQVNKISQEFTSLKVKSPYSKGLYQAGAIALLVVLGSIGVNKLVKQSASAKALTIINDIKKKELILSEIQSFTVAIQPPSYTGKPSTTQSSFNLKVPVGSAVKWQLHSNVKAEAISFTFNDSLKLSLKATNAEKTVWQLAKTITQSGFYQVNIDGKLSDLYQIETIKDATPIITVTTPKPNTVIDFGQPTKVPLHLTITDDYGISDAYISATITSGSGEGVKFKEQKIALATSFQSRKLNYTIQQTIDLKKLAMQPGDELYFYIKAIDNFKQESRSDIFIITLPDTTQLMSLEGLANNINFKPEIFRSERQIIIDAEQLLKDKDTISSELFKERSNNLGIDQKLLRLRYGKYLGEENESNQGIENVEGLDAKEFGDGAAMMDAVTDKHDNAEDATFLDADTKKRLKAVLNEMWSTELQLRTFKPQDALPFAYTALRLLKDLQQSSRVYVAKTSLKITPLKPEKRLTADLSKIVPPSTQQQVVIAASNNTILKEALSILETIKVNKQPINTSALLQALTIIGSKASAEPATYLPALTALKELLLSQQAKQATAPVASITIIQRAIQKILEQPIQTPQQIMGKPNQKLSKEYFNNLYKNQ